MPLLFDILVALMWLLVVLATTAGPNNGWWPVLRQISFVCAVYFGNLGQICAYVFSCKPLSGKTVSAKLAGARMSALGWRWFVDIYVLWKIPTAHHLGPQGVTAKPFLFLQAAGLQWFNSKNWAMSIVVIIQFVMVDLTLYSAVTVAEVFSIVEFW